MLSIFIILIAYLLGSIPTGYIIAKINNVDIQNIGSGNIGATNVLRTVGRRAALIVIIADPLKGAIAVGVAILFRLNPWVVALCSLAAVLGHNFNVFLKFRGGKGIATSAGAFLVLAPISTSFGIIIAALTIFLGRYVSLGSILGVASTQLFLILYHPEFAWSKLCIGAVLLALGLWRHKDNIARLAKGTERRIGEKAVSEDKNDQNQTQDTAAKNKVGDAKTE